MASNLGVLARLGINPNEAVLASGRRSQKRQK